MPIPPRFECLVGQPPTPIGPTSPQWAMPLPTRRPVPAADAGAPAVSYGDYFSAVCDYLSQDGMAVPVRAAGAISGHAVGIDHIQAVQVHLIKHGAFYHPALVTFDVNGERMAMVVNVAVGDRGRRQLPIEVDSLNRLNRSMPHDLVPRVYDMGSGCAPGHPPFPMFAGKWFADFHEVHRTRGGDPARPQWSVWDTRDGPWRLDEAGVADYFRQAMHLLACCFDPHTFSAILDWHHAAGDFIVRKTPAGLEVRLITVRRYAPFFEPGQDDTVDLALLLETLAVFWMRTSLWMRLDRMDGVGELVWAGDHIIAPLWDGFVSGLNRMARRNGFPEDFGDGVRRFLAGYTREAWMDMGSGIVARYPQDRPETELIGRHLPGHAVQTADVIQKGP